MLPTRIAALAALICVFTFPAQAQTGPNSQNHITCDLRGCSDLKAGTPAPINQRTSNRRIKTSGGIIVGGRPKGCPWRYCGCGVSLKVFGRIIPELNLALNWKRKFPRTSPAPGMVAARSGHVFYINSVIDRYTVMAYDPNSGGGKTRIHQRSLRGYTVVNPHGSRMAMN